MSKAPKLSKRRIAGTPAGRPKPLTEPEKAQHRDLVRRPTDSGPREEIIGQGFASSAHLARIRHWPDR